MTQKTLSSKLRRVGTSLQFSQTPFANCEDFHFFFFFLSPGSGNSVTKHKTLKKKIRSETSFVFADMNKGVNRILLINNERQQMWH